MQRRGLTTVAIDARLIGTHMTGDATHWAGILQGFCELFELENPHLRLLFLCNAPKPSGIPWNDAFEWVEVPGAYARWWSLVQFPLAARRRGAQVAHVQYTLSPLVRGGVTTVHDVSFFIGPDWFSLKDRTLLQLGVAASARRAKRVVTVSETSRADIEQYLPGARGKTVVVPNACPPWIHPNPKEMVDAHLEELGLSRPFCLTVGTRWPRKNMELAVRAMDLLPERFTHRLAITGKAGWGDQTLGNRAQALGYVSNEQLCSLYCAADLYLAPSRHEGFGLPLLEAFRCGCPVICSSGGALPEVADNAALVMDSWEPEAWSVAIQDLLDDSSKLQGLRERGLNRVGDFSWLDSARRLRDLYLEVAKCSTPNS